MASQEKRYLVVGNGEKDGKIYSRAFAIKTYNGNEYADAKDVHYLEEKKPVGTIVTIVLTVK